MKKTLFAIAIVCVLGLLSMLVYSIFKKAQIKRVAKENLMQLPDLILYNLDSSRFHFPQSSLAVIFFDTGCEICVDESAQIFDHKKSFSNKNIVMISSERIETIREFMIQSKLNELPTVVFTKILPEQVFKNFGSLTVPHVFIYDHEHNLVREFKGGVKASIISDSLPERK